jgi:alkanesulfonate monooxygenase SsuD/methylene tetrahydromethanopterin reductase-like flavin-dependent oxidoreductase (luciferase family)
MQFGIFSLMGYREPGTPTTRIFEEAAEQTRLADALGYDVAWFAEHHFSNYCVCPSPLMMVAHLHVCLRKSAWPMQSAVAG